MNNYILFYSTLLYRRRLYSFLKTSFYKYNSGQHDMLNIRLFSIIFMLHGTQNTTQHTWQTTSMTMLIFKIPFDIL